MNAMGKGGCSFFFMIDAWAEHWVVLEVKKAIEEGFQWFLEGKGYYLPSRICKKNYRFHFDPVPFERYAQAFAITRAAQLRGESWLANLTFPSLLHTDFTLKDIFAHANSPFRLYIPQMLTVFSPERFIRISSQGKISSYPMKGTIRSDVPNSVNTVLADPKETAEHITIVDLIRNDLTMVANNVHVMRYRFISMVKRNQVPLFQVSSEITGELQSDWRKNLGSIFATILPAGSVTGAPKKRTGEIIQEAELYDRDWYTGVFGYFNGSELDSAVSIRFIKQVDNKLVYLSGGGITINSDVHREYAELKEKIYVPSA